MRIDAEGFMTRITLIDTEGYLDTEGTEITDQKNNEQPRKALKTRKRN